MASRCAGSYLALNCEQAIIDGEMVVLSDKGVASFPFCRQICRPTASTGWSFYAFDLLHLNNTALLEEPLIERKSQLEELLTKSTKVTRYSEHFEEPGETMLAHACRMGLEGVISKQIDAPYHSGRTLDWIKSKCTLRQEFIVIGYLASAATGRGLRSIIVGYRKNGKLGHAGRVGTGFSTKSGR